MKLHIIGGFLGSGKTTAIVQAARLLVDQGQRVGIITNDQGKYLVDTAFFRLSSLPTVEVTSGCFCCNYDDLNLRLAQVIEAASPDVIFAESVGSCADIIATVVKPLLELSQDRVKPSSFSVFTDARLLRRWLLQQEMPFSEDVSYIFGKQIEEAGLVVINKSDLLDESTRVELAGLYTHSYPQKDYLVQSSLSTAGVQPWITKLQSGSLTVPETTLEIDYTRYGAGEARLAWLDEEVQLRFPEGQGQARLHTLLSTLLVGLGSYRIGHFKVMIKAPVTAAKISFTSQADPGWESRIPWIEGQEAWLLLNARVEMPAGDLKALFHRILEESGQPYFIREEAAFHPAQPNPTFRIP